MFKELRGSFLMVKEITQQDRITIAFIDRIKELDTENKMLKKKLKDQKERIEDLKHGTC